MSNKQLQAIFSIFGCNVLMMQLYFSRQVINKILFFFPTLLLNCMCKGFNNVLEYFPILKDRKRLGVSSTINQFSDAR